MTRRIAAVLVAGLISVGADLGAAARRAEARVRPGEAQPPPERRAASLFNCRACWPLVVFWITRSDIGDAVVTRRLAPGEATYTLLIGSDPDRAPRRINRWGYIRRDSRRRRAADRVDDASEEESIEEAEANRQKQAHGDHPFKIIRATVDGEQAHSTVTSVTAPHDYSFRQLQTVLDLAVRESPDAKPRTIQLPRPARAPGFLPLLPMRCAPRPARSRTCITAGFMTCAGRTLGRFPTCESPARRTAARRLRTSPSRAGPTTVSSLVFR